MRPLPVVNTLSDGFQAVIRSNRQDGYPPTIFEQMNQDVAAMTNLIWSDRAKTAVRRALRSHRDLLTIEDFVSRYGQSWGFDTATIAHAQDSVCEFDRIVGHQRYK